MKIPAFPIRALGALSALLALTVPAWAANYDRMVVFGDSLSDNGNLGGLLGPGILPLLNYDPQRITSGPTTFPASTFTGVAVEHLNDRLGLDPLTPALAGGSNYAWAFATTGLGGLDLGAFVTPGTQAQVGSYLTANPVVSGDSLHVLWAGSNDLLAATTPAELQMAATIAVANLTGQLTALLSAGAEHVMWFNIPDLGLTPRASLLDPALTTELHNASLQFREGWSVALQQLRMLFPDAEITGVDIYSAFNAMVADPAAYGFTNTTTPAQGQFIVDPDQYVFWDDVHPTAAAHAIIGDYAFQQLQPVPEPATYGLFAAAGLIGWVIIRRRARAV